MKCAQCDEAYADDTEIHLATKNEGGHSVCVSGKMTSLPTTKYTFRHRKIPKCQPAAATIMVTTWKYGHRTELVKKLHWVPTHQGLTFTLLLLTLLPTHQGLTFTLLLLTLLPTHQGLTFTLLLTFTAFCNEGPLISIVDKTAYQY